MLRELCVLLPPTADVRHIVCRGGCNGVVWIACGVAKCHAQLLWHTFNLKREDGSIDQQAVKEYAAAVRQKIADKIAQEQGTGIYYKGAMDRIPGINA